MVIPEHERKNFTQMLALVGLLLCVSPGLGDDKPPDCDTQDPVLCSSSCIYLKDKCKGSRVCMYDLCSYLYSQLSPRYLDRCWDLSLDCSDDFRNRNKRGVLNKNVAYLLLKLHPFLNQSSQFGFLTSGRFRRISSNFGTEFLGKRSNTKPTESRYSQGNSRNLPKPKPTPQFYSLPLNKFAKAKILKRGDITDELIDSREKKLSIRGNGKVLIGSEFLGKRGYRQNEKIRRLSGNEFLGKRADDFLDGSEFLGKRAEDTLRDADILGKRPREPEPGTELLGKKSSQNSEEELLVKRFGNELLGKRLSQREFLDLKRKNEQEFWPELDPQPTYEAFLNYDPFNPSSWHFCGENNCGRSKTK